MTTDVPLPSPDDPTATGVPADVDAAPLDSAPLDSAPLDDVASDAEALASAQRGLRLLELVREIEKHVASEGWDQNPRMFALALTSELVRLEPELAAALGAAADDPESLTPIEQEPLDTERALDEVLATTMWPEEVVGAALVLERVVLPPEAEATVDETDPVALAAALANHPDRQDVRMAVVVTRDGGRMCALRLRSHDADADVLVGEDVVPRLAAALAATLT